MIIWSFATWHFFASLTHGFSCSWWYNNKKKRNLYKKYRNTHWKMLRQKQSEPAPAPPPLPKSFRSPVSVWLQFHVFDDKIVCPGTPALHTHANGSLAGVYDLWWALMHGCYYFHISVRGFVYSCALLPRRYIVFLFFLPSHPAIAIDIESLQMCNLLIESPSEGSNSSSLAPKLHRERNCRSQFPLSFTNVPAMASLISPRARFATVVWSFQMFELFHFSHAAMVTKSHLPKPSLYDCTQSLALSLYLSLTHMRALSLFFSRAHFFPRQTFAEPDFYYTPIMCNNERAREASRKKTTPLVCETLLSCEQYSLIYHEHKNDLYLTLK